MKDYCFIGSTITRRRAGEPREIVILADDSEGVVGPIETMAEMFPDCNVQAVPVTVRVPGLSQPLIYSAVIAIPREG